LFIAIFINTCEIICMVHPKAGKICHHIRHMILIQRDFTAFVFVSYLYKDDPLCIYYCCICI